MASFNEMRNAVNGTAETLVEKDFTVYAVREERGVFITQRRTVAVGSVRARSIQEAREEVKRLYADMSTAYPAERVERD